MMHKKVYNVKSIRILLHVSIDIHDVHHLWTYITPLNASILRVFTVFYTDFVKVLWMILQIINQNAGA